ncbi:hypothetical protein IY40_11055 [Serratia marcescens]|nr:hypothetical protein IY40_11055 [Serratia marcescens]
MFFSIRSINGHALQSIGRSVHDTFSELLVFRRKQFGNTVVSVAKPDSVQSIIQLKRQLVAIIQRPVEIKQAMAIEANLEVLSMNFGSSLVYDLF